LPWPARAPIDRQAIEPGAALCQKQGRQFSRGPAVTRKQLLLAVVCAALVAVAVAAYYVLTGNESDTAASLPQPGERYGVQVAPDDKTLGSPKAPIVMLEYAAPTCPHCAHFDMDFFPLLKEQYIETGKVYYIFRVFPLSAADVAAENIALCLPADNYFQFIDLLFRNQAKWDPEYRVPDVHAGLVEMGRIAGLSQSQVDGCIGNQTEGQKISQIGQEATAKYGVNGTPTFIVNGQAHGPFMDYDELKGFLDPMLAKK
jgi:protein-disulfide isomerase